MGFVQYFAGLPVAVVMLHMLGAALVVAAATWLLVTVLEPAPIRESSLSGSWAAPPTAGDVDDG